MKFSKKVKAIFLLLFEKHPRFIFNKRGNKRTQMSYSAQRDDDLPPPHGLPWIWSLVHSTAITALPEGMSPSGHMTATSSSDAYVLFLRLVVFSGAADLSQKKSSALKKGTTCCSKVIPCQFTATSKEEATLRRKSIVDLALLSDDEKNVRLLARFASGAVGLLSIPAACFSLVVSPEDVASAPPLSASGQLLRTTTSSTTNTNSSTSSKKSAFLLLEEVFMTDGDGIGRHNTIIPMRIVFSKRKRTARVLCGTVAAAVASNSSSKEQNTQHPTGVKDRDGKAATDVEMMRTGLQTFSLCLEGCDDGPVQRQQHGASSSSSVSASPVTDVMWRPQSVWAFPCSFPRCVPTIVNAFLGSPPSPSPQPQPLRNNKNALSSVAVPDDDQHDDGFLFSTFDVAVVTTTTTTTAASVSHNNYRLFGGVVVFSAHDPEEKEEPRSSTHHAELKPGTFALSFSPPKFLDDDQVQNNNRHLHQRRHEFVSYDEVVVRSSSATTTTRTVGTATVVEQNPVSGQMQLSCFSCGSSSAVSSAMSSAAGGGGGGSSAGGGSSSIGASLGGGGSSVLLSTIPLPAKYRSGCRREDTGSALLPVLVTSTPCFCRCFSNAPTNNNNNNNNKSQPNTSAVAAAAAGLCKLIIYEDFSATIVYVSLKAAPSSSSSSSSSASSLYLESSAWSLAPFAMVSPLAVPMSVSSSSPSSSSYYASSKLIRNAILDKMRLFSSQCSCCCNNDNNADNAKREGGGASSCCLSSAATSHFSLVTITPLWKADVCATSVSCSDASDDSKQLEYESAVLDRISQTKSNLVQLKNTIGELGAPTMITASSKTVIREADASSSQQSRLPTDLPTLMEVSSKVFSSSSSSTQNKSAKQQQSADADGQKEKSSDDHNNDDDVEEEEYHLRCHSVHLDVTLLMMHRSNNTKKEKQQVRQLCRLRLVPQQGSSGERSSTSSAAALLFSSGDSRDSADDGDPRQRPPPADLRVKSVDLLDVTTPPLALHYRPSATAALFAVHCVGRGDRSSSSSSSQKDCRYHDDDHNHNSEDKSTTLFLLCAVVHPKLGGQLLLLKRFVLRPGQVPSWDDFDPTTDEKNNASSSSSSSSSIVARLTVVDVDAVIGTTEKKQQPQLLCVVRTKQPQQQGSGGGKKDNVLQPYRVDAE